MPLYTFRLPAAFSSTPVTVYNSADVQQTTGTTDANAQFAATLPTGDYYAKVSYGYTSYRAAGEVNRGDLDNISEAGLSATYGPARVKVSDLVYPLVVPHRGAGQDMYPQGNITAYRIGAEGFDNVDGGDLRMLPDGSFVDFHDTTLDSTTTAAGNVWKVSSSSQMRSLTFKDVTGFPAGLLSNQRPAMWDDIAREFGGKRILYPEIKWDGTSPPPAGQQGAAFAALLAKQGLTKSVVVGSFFLAELIPLVQAGVECCWYPVNDASTQANLTNAQAARDAGVQQVGITATGGVSTTATVAAYLSMGFRVSVGVLSRQYDWQQWLAAGTSWCYSEQPLYVGGQTSRYRVTSDNFGSGVFPPGMIAASENYADRGTLANGRWFPKFAAATTLLGQFSPVANPAGTYTINATVCFENLGSDASRHADIVVAAADDRYFDAAVPRAVNSGYNVAIRPSATNTIQIYEVVNGTTTSRANVNSTALVAPVTLTAGLTTSATTTLAVSAIPADVPSGTKFALPTMDVNGKPQIVTTTALASTGATSLTISSVTPRAAVASGTALPQAVPLTIQVTPTQIIVTRTDTGTVATATSSAVRGGYIHAGQNNNNGASGMQVSYANISIS